MSELFTEVVCLECQQAVPADIGQTTCPYCGSSWLDARYDYAAVAGLWPASLTSREHSMWRYAELMPLAAPDEDLKMGEGFTSLIRMKHYERAYDHHHIYIKDERQGATSSFKDRQAALSVQAMHRAGITECVLASTGNAGVAYAAYCARAGIKLWLFLTSLAIGDKLREAALYGAEVVRVSGTYDETKHVAAEFARRKNIHFDRGAKAIPGKESMKTLAYEIAEQLGLRLHPDKPGTWQAPDWYIQAVSGGIGPLGVWKGFNELYQMGLIDRIPKMGIVQVAGCAPMVKAFHADQPQADPVVPKTLITVLATGDPGYAYVLLRDAVQRNGGAFVAVEDGITFESMRNLARQGGFSVEPATAVAFAGLEQMLADGTIRQDEVVVVNCSGHTFPVESHILGDQLVLDLELNTLGEAQEEGLDAAIRRLDEQATSILLVDDNPDDRRLIRRLLQRYKRYRIHEAAGGKEALRQVWEHRPDLIIADLTMPEMDGFTLLEKLKSSPETARIPVTVVSAKNLSQAETRLLDNYSESVWAKGGFETRRLVEHVAETLGHSPVPPAAGPAIRMVSADQTEEPAQPLETIVIIEDNPQDRRLARRLLEIGGHYRVIEAQDGRDGLKAVYEYRPALVLLDLMLPEMDGFSVLEAIRGDANLRDIPVIVLSAKDLNQQERDRLANQILSIITKATWDKQQFLDMIHNALK
ncbi:MAG: pyridoxal-phosphate dependent enzyme [Anaerolineaceae bacterium]|nr:pyridoxal-phosphate dependent enzyme [Anaerolineaceae bacterium]